MNLRNALPNASFIGFTGTPLFKDDEITKRIFGDYVSRYDFKRSVDDGATVPLYYENRGEYLGLKNPVINEQIRAVIDDESEDLDSDQRSRVEQLFAREYPILTAKKRLDAIAKDAVWHFCNRGYKGKGMFIALDKLTAVKMYDLITEYWKKYVEQLEKEVSKGKYGDQELLEKSRELQWIKETEICVVVSSEQNEIQKFQKWDLDIEPHREKMNTQDIETRFKDEDDPFRFVIVCAMWITGFDVPTLSTLYLDKPLNPNSARLRNRFAFYTDFFKELAGFRQGDLFAFEGHVRQIHKNMFTGLYERAHKFRKTGAVPAYFAKHQAIVFVIQYQ
jgi:type I restriction enzyme R subunit